MWRNVSSGARLIDAEPSESGFLRFALGDMKVSVQSYCYECHEELLHDPVLLPEDIRAFSELVKTPIFTKSRSRITGRDSWTCSISCTR